MKIFKTTFICFLIGLFSFSFVGCKKKEEVVVPPPIPQQVSVDEYAGKLLTKIIGSSYHVNLKYKSDVEADYEPMGDFYVFSQGSAQRLVYLDETTNQISNIYEFKNIQNETKIEVTEFVWPSADSVDKTIKFRIYDDIVVSDESEKNETEEVSNSISNFAQVFGSTNEDKLLIKKINDYSENWGSTPEGVLVDFLNYFNTTDSKITVASNIAGNNGTYTLSLTATIKEDEVEDVVSFEISVVNDNFVSAALNLAGDMFILDVNYDVNQNLVPADLGRNLPYVEETSEQEDSEILLLTDLVNCLNTTEHFAVISSGEDVTNLAFLLLENGQRFVFLDDENHAKKIIDFDKIVDAFSYNVTRYTKTQEGGYTYKIFDVIEGENNEELEALKFGISELPELNFSPEALLTSILNLAKNDAQINVAEEEDKTTISVKFQNEVYKIEVVNSMPVKISKLVDDSESLTITLEYFSETQTYDIPSDLGKNDPYINEDGDESENLDDLENLQD